MEIQTFTARAYSGVLMDMHVGKRSLISTMISSKVKYSPLLLQVGTGVPNIQVFSDMIFVGIRAHAQCGLLDHDPQYPLDTNIHVCHKNNGDPHVNRDTSIHYKY